MTMRKDVLVFWFILVLGMGAFGIHKVDELSTHFETQQRSYEGEDAICYPVLNGNVIVNGEIVDADIFEFIVARATQAINSAPVLKKQVKDIMESEGPPNLNSRRYNRYESIDGSDHDPIHPFFNDMIAAQIYEIYRRERSLVHRLIKLYNRKWSDKEFKKRTLEYIEEQERR